MTENLLVSIVIPTFDAARTLPRAIDSLMRQGEVSWELIVVDDGSTDNTLESIQQYRHRLGNRMQYLRQQRAGSSVARNTGIDRAHGQYVAFLDADDEFAPNKLIRQLELFYRRPDLGLVYSDFAYNDLSGHFHKSVFEELVQRDGTVRMEEISPGLCVCDRQFLDRMVASYLISPITALVRRSLLGSDVRFPPGQQYSEEWLFFLDVASRCRVGYVAEPLSIQHQTPGSLSLANAARNTQHQVRAMRRILDRYPHASRSSRQKLKGKLAHCLRQMAFDYFKRGQYRSARSAFWKALKQHVDLSTAVHLAQASWAARSQALQEEAPASAVTQG